MAPWFEPKGGDQLLGGEVKTSHQVNPEPGVNCKSGVIPKDPIKLPNINGNYTPEIGGVTLIHLITGQFQVPCGCEYAPLYR